MSSEEEYSTESDFPSGPPLNAKNVRYSNVDLSLQWRRLDTSKMGEFSETGLGVVEEIPAGSYEIVKTPDGGVIIKMKPNAYVVGTDKPDANTRPEEDPKKRKRDGVPAEGDTKKTKKQKSTSRDQGPLFDDDKNVGSLILTETKEKSRLTGKEPKKADGSKNKGALGPRTTEKEAVPMDKMLEVWGPMLLHPKILENLAILGYGAPTPIQSASIPPAVAHFKDIVGAAATGSGKTAAYCLPIIHRLLERRENLHMGCVPRSLLPEGQKVEVKQWEDLPALILTPTRELALQVSAHLKAFTKDTAIRTVTVVGGFAMEKQERLLRSHPDIIVATPGRLWDLISSKKYRCLQNLSNLQFLVMDEADRLVEKGHFQSLNNIIMELRKKRELKVKEVLDPEAERILFEKKKEWEKRKKRDKSKPLLQEINYDFEDDPEEPVNSHDQNQDEELDEDTIGEEFSSGDEEDEELVEDDSDGYTHGDDEAEEPDYADAPAPSEMDEDGVFAMMEQSGEVEDTSDDEASVSKPDTNRRSLGRGVPPHDRLVATPAHYKRQTFLFSATLGVATRQSIQDAARALVEAQAMMDGHVTTDHNDRQKVALSKKAYRRALAKASQLTPVEALMARVGLQSKPEVVVTGAGGASTRDASLLTAAGNFDADNADEEDIDEIGASATDLSKVLRDASQITLPKGLKLARITVTDENKDVHLYSFLLHYPGRTLIFVNAIAALKKLQLLLSALRLPTFALHAQMQQRQRVKHLERFRATENGVLVATDVAARGLDIPAVDYVVHHAVPRSAETFVHRSGRTARGSSSGLALALVGPADVRAYSQITRTLGMVAGLPEFPITDGVVAMRRLVQRVSLARKIAQAQTELDRDTAEQNWAVSTAAAAGLQLDEHTIEELGGVKEVLATAKLKQGDRSSGEESEDEGRMRGKKGAKVQKKKKSALGLRAGDDEDADLDFTLKNVTDKFDDDEKANTIASIKQRRKHIVMLRRELDALLHESLLPHGTSQKFITSNPLLNQSPHPLQAMITIGTPAIPSTNMDSEENEENEENKDGKSDTKAGGKTSSVPAPAERSGMALVAPRVILPGSLCTVSAGFNRQGGMLVGNTAVGGKSKLKSAIQELVLHGKHGHLPGSRVAASNRNKAKVAKANSR